MIPDRANNVSQWEFDKLVVILLRQFKRLLAERGAEMTDAEMRLIGQKAAAREALPEETEAARDALRRIVDESVQVLQGWNLDFATALKTTMTDIPGWESTADFLQIANEKGNAEIRISAGSALLSILGDASRARYCLQAVDHDLQTLDQLDVDAIIAKRALLYASRVDGDADDWRDQVAAWVESQGESP